ncbi:methionine ABC transporter substrate-binding protein [Corynebacterium atypicum]|uniref:Methionine ABC transporter substrate-binding protein n=1 Tax=Corynebacterium atypicum TaxID=191610 RepID=A0ABN4DBJ9_9CORY|nr:MetQ/NlpA family ABC transporter substrate-binding protein [Corynebacterium atypicum]AIG63731.1 methionine ABC transporter substrate-binding protein [Corynebacterium atypicum]
MHLHRALAAGTGALLTVSALTACGAYDNADSASSDPNAPIRIGTTDGQKEAWRVFEDKAKAEGIELDIQEFGDFNTPNDALAQGALDVNLFQHLKFLAAYNAGFDADLTPVGASEVIPLALYWKGHDSLDGIEGKSVAIPNDSTNQGRAINVLKQAGLVELTGEGQLDPTPADIDEAASKVSVTPVDAAQATAAWGEGQPAIINNTFLERAGIDPNSAIFEDDPNSPEAEPYINVFVVKAADKDNERVAKLVELWHTPEVQEAVDRDSKGTSVEVERPAAELQQILDRLVKDQKAAENK